MDSFIQNIAAAFGLRCSSISRERFGHLCSTPDGPVLIQKMQKNPALIDGIMFQHEVKEHLFDHGFGATDRFLTTVDLSLPYHKVGEDVFTASRAYDAPRANFADGPGFLGIVGELARMHRTLAGVAFAARPQRKPEAAQADKAVEVLTGFRRRLMKAGKFSEFDMLFLKALEKFEPKMSAWAVMPKDILGNNNFVCHNLLKEENIYMTDAGPIFTNFAMAGQGHYLNDLVYIVKRYLKAHPAGCLPLADILAAYDTHHPMEGFDREFFVAMLEYPDKFVKLARDYYSKKRNFAPKTYLTRMEECNVRGQALEEYLHR